MGRETAPGCSDSDDDVGRRPALFPTNQAAAETCALLLTMPPELATRHEGVYRDANRHARPPAPSPIHAVVQRDAARIAPRADLDCVAGAVVELPRWRPPRNRERRP